MPRALEARIRRLERRHGPTPALIIVVNQVAPDGTTTPFRWIRMEAGRGVVAKSDDGENWHAVESEGKWLTHPSSGGAGRDDG